MSEFPQALNRLKKFNDFILNNQALAKIFVFGEYNFLQAYQEVIFLDFVSFFERKDRGVDPLSPLVHGSIIRVKARQLLAVFISLISYLFLVISRRKILIFTSNRLTSFLYKCDFRMDNLYRYLTENKVKYFEIIHAVFGKGFISLVFKRKRPAIYLESLDLPYKFWRYLEFFRRDYSRLVASLDFSSFGEEKKFFRGILVKHLDSIGRSKFRITFLRRLLKLTAVKILIATPDSRNCNELVAACNLNNIKTYGLQAGNISKYDRGLFDCGGLESKVIKFQKMFVWSRYWKDELLRLGTCYKENEIEIGGNLKEDYVEEINPEADYGNKNDKNLSVLIPYEIAAPKEEVLEYIKKFLMCPNVRVIFKLRADRNLSEQALEYGLKDISNNLILISDLKEINHFDIVAGTYSTFLYEMIGKLKPVVILKTSLDYGEGMIINGIADELDIKKGDICGQLMAIKNIRADILIKKRNKLYAGTVPLALKLNEILKF